MQGAFNSGTHGVGSRSHTRDTGATYADLLGWINVRSHGARGDGTTDDTIALQAALDAVPSTGGVVYIPPASGGSYLVSRGLRHKSNTLVIGSGPAGWIKVASSFAADSDGYWMVFRNVNGRSSETAFTGYRDFNMEFRNVWVDMRLAGNQGAIHAFNHRAAQCVKIINCYSLGGGDCTAAITCDDHLVQGCTAIDSHNCCYDHWGGSTNCRVIGCYGEVSSTSVSQLVNFNGIVSAAGETWASDGFLLADCDLYGNATQRSINVEQLGTGGSTVKNVRIHDNRIYDSRIVIGGGTTGVVVSNNQFIGSSGVTPTVFCRTQNGINPDLVTVIGNQFRDCNAPNGFGLIDTTGTNLVAIGNIAIGGTYQYGVRFAAGGGFAALNRMAAASIAETSGASALIATTGANLMLGASGGGLGFYGSAGATKPTITGSRGGNAALASVVAQLASLGLVTDGTTA